MEISDAKAVVQNYRQQSLAALGEAISVLKKKYDTYEKIAKQVSPSAKTIGLYYRLSQLPDGIRWKIQEGEIGLSLAEQVCRLKDENDQWVLAYAIVDAAQDRSIMEQEWKGAVDEVLRTGRSMKEVLEERLGAASDKTVVTPVSFDYSFRFKLCRAAWNRQKNWADLVYDIINEWLDGREFSSTADLKGISRELIDAASRIEELAE